MNSKKIIGILALGVLALAIIYFVSRQKGESLPPPSPAPTPVTNPTFDPRNASFEVEGSRVTLVNGLSETQAAPGSASKITTRYFGNDATGDINGDGFKDTAFLITQNSGGSGLFYYAVVALQTANGYTTTNAFFIGDRIAPQSTEMHSDSREIHVNYAERKPGEPMTAQPSVGAVKLLKVTPEGKLTGLME